jgi:hypothetical protein
VFTDRTSTTVTGTVVVENNGPAAPEAPPPDQVTCHVTVADTWNTPPGRSAELRV